MQCSKKLFNIVTKSEVHNSDYLLNIGSFGEQLYRTFVEDRLQEKSVSLHALISSKYSSVNVHTVAEKKSPKPLSEEAENSRAVNYLQCAKSRG